MTVPYGQPDATVAELMRRVEKLTKINNALMQRVERSMDQQANAFSLFQAAIGLESQVRIRTEELNSALERLEIANEQLVAARDAAELANRIKTRFFTAAGHDLLQPLHAARLSLSALSEKRQETQQVRLVGQIDHALSSIEELLRSILDLSKLEAGVIRPALQAVRLSDMFRSLIFDTEPIARMRALRLSMRKTDLMVRSDNLMLRRMLQNLLANAINYTEHGSVLLAARRRGANVRIEVWDTGPGIECEEQERMFEEFQRGAAAGRGAGTGFGLGLSIVQRTAEALGHKVEVCSKLRHGTRFSVFAPYAGRAEDTARVDEEPSVRTAYDLAGRAAVVIDNDANVLEAMRVLLGKWSCNVRTAQSLRDIERIYEAEPGFLPDIVLADFHLDHGETGTRAVEWLRVHAKSALPAVIITADHSTEVAAEAARTECEILKKPVRPAELRALIQHLLR